MALITMTSHWYQGVLNHGDNDRNFNKSVKLTTKEAPKLLVTDLFKRGIGNLCIARNEMVDSITKRTIIIVLILWHYMVCRAWFTENGLICTSADKIMTKLMSCALIILSFEMPAICFSFLKRQVFLHWLTVVIMRKPSDSMFCANKDDQQRKYIGMYFSCSTVDWIVTQPELARSLVV